MSKYLCDCHKCTNKAVNLKGDLYCIPIMQGRQGIYLQSGTCGANFVFACDEYTTENRQIVLYEPGDKLYDRFKAFAEGRCGTGWDKHGQNGTVFCLTNSEDVSVQEHKDRLLMRIYKLRELNYAPYVMIYDKAHAPRELKRIARWCNNKHIFYQTERYEDYEGGR